MLNLNKYKRNFIPLYKYKYKLNIITHRLLHKIFKIKSLSRQNISALLCIPT